ELGAEGATGLITYMRTDSTRISDEAEGRVKAWIVDKHGSKYIGGPRVAKSAPGTQDAHEAVRPTDVNRTPDSIREHLTPEQFKLYDLIWRRFVASRMAPAVYDQTQVEIEGAAYIFRATGSVLAFDGFKVISDDEYTATLEKRLDQVESGHEDWVPVVSGFYGPLQKMLTDAQEAMPADTDEVCPECHDGHLVRKASRFGPFMGCSR